MLKGLNLRLLKEKGWLDDPSPPAAIGPQRPRRSGHQKGRGRGRGSCGRRARYRAPLQGRIDDSFLYVTF